MQEGRPAARRTLPSFTNTRVQTGILQYDGTIPLLHLLCPKIVRRRT